MANNEITLVRSSNGDLVEAGTTKIEEIEVKISEVESNLSTLADNSARAVEELLELAIASQNPIHYEVLSKVITASAKVNQTTILALQAKYNLYDNGGGNKPVGINDEQQPQSVVNNNTLLLTTTEAVRALLEAQKAPNPPSEE